MTAEATTAADVRAKGPPGGNGGNAEPTGVACRLMDATLITDPGCPWAYSANPDVAMLRWRYGDALTWRLVMIGLAEDTARYERAGYTPARMAQGYLRFRDRFGMPFGAA